MKGKQIANEGNRSYHYHVLCQIKHLRTHWARQKFHYHG